MSTNKEIDELEKQINEAVDGTKEAEPLQLTPPKKKHPMDRSPGRPPGRTAEELADRRFKELALHNRGMTYKQIGEEVGVAIATVKRDLDWAKAQVRNNVLQYDRDDHVATNISQYDDIITEAWKVHKGANKDTKIKALHLIRQTMQAKERSLQSNGVVRKEVQAQEIVQVSLVSKYDDSDIGKAAAALLAQGLNLHLGEPTQDLLDMEEAEIVEDDNEESND